MTIDNLDAVSLVLVYSAMGVYALAFIAFAFDFVSAPRTAAPAARQRQLVAEGAGGAAVIVATKPPKAQKSDQPGGKRASRNFGRAAFALTIIAWILHLAGLVLRGVAAGRVPWANMYEFALTGVAIIVGVFLFAQFWRDLRFLGVYISGIALVFLGVATVNFWVAPVPLPPSLQSYWLVIHVFVATLGTGFFALGSGLSILQLLRARKQQLSFMQKIPGSDALEDLAYRVTIIGFIFWTFTLMAGAIWARESWGRYWGWDTKEVWTFIIWVIYAGYIHARATRGWRGVRSSWLQLVGFAAIIFNFTIVNIYFKGLHTYSGLE